jgi:hypothetical protein
MLVEWLKYLTRPAAPELKAMGYLGEAIALESRYRRCLRDWQPHLAESRAAVGEAIGRCRHRRRAVVLGSGLALDLPLEQLAGAFEHVCLVDVLHPPSLRRRAKRLGNVELLAADVTGTIALLYRVDAARPFQPPVPRRLAILDADDLDLVVSLNLLSQLAVLPIRWLERRLGSPADAAIAGFAQSLVAAHLADLRSCRAMTCLISDVERLTIAADGTVIERHSILAEIEPPTAARSWTWRIAPAPELDPDWSEERRVIAAFELARTAACTAVPRGNVLLPR